MRTIFLLALAVFGIGVCGYYFYSQSTQETTQSTQTEEVHLNLLPPRTPPAGYKEYRSEQYRISFFYPESFSMDEFDEGQAARTITIEDADHTEGLQIFIVPYLEEKVNDERFLQDNPSGVRNNPKEITIDGTVAASFYGTDVNLGDTAEIWIIRNGYLYEITTLASLDVWLSNVMASWKFI